MRLLDWLRNRFSTRARKEQFAYLRSIRPKHRAVLIAAAFLLFLAIGVQGALIGNAPPHLLNSLLWGVLGGLTGSAYVTFMSRGPKVIPLIVLGQCAANVGLARVLEYFNKQHPAEDLRHILEVDAPLTLIATVTAYSLFFTFINMEGRFAFRAQTELALAHAIQKTLAPVVEVVHGRFEFYGVSAPSEKVGGDLVDVVELGDGSTAAYVADVAGHGLQAGILMGMIKTAARTRLMDAAELPGLFDRLNRVLPGVKEQNMYATSAALLLRQSGEEDAASIEYAVAGHPAILHFSQTGTPLPALGDEQFPLGLFPRAEYRSQRTTAARGDLLILTTDGVLEAANARDQEFGEARLGAIVAAHWTEPLSSIAGHILAAVREWGKQEDDQTLLLVRVR